MKPTRAIGLIGLVIPVLATLSRAQPSTPPGTKFPKIAICAVESGDSRGGSGSAVHFTMSDSPLTREIRRLVAEGKIENGGTLLRTLGFLADGEHETASTSLLVSNHMEAFAARKAHSWAKEVPHEIFLTDVLPHACLDETRENWRPGFRRRFAPMVAGTKTLREAALIINKRIRDELQVDYNTKREKANQSPSESLRQGMASCTGLSILLCNAFRSVGIPARIVGTSWKHKPGNHTWVEFHDPATGQWHFTEYYPDEKGPDHGWIIADVAHAIPGDKRHAVYATSWRSTGKSFPLPWNESNRSLHAIDVTERYLAFSKNSPSPPDRIELRIDFRDAAGRRLAVLAEVRCGETILASGMTPGPTRDENDFLTIHAPPSEQLSVKFGTQVPRRILPDGNPFLRVAGTVASD